MISDDSTKMPLESARRSDQSLIKITREIPLTWLVAAIIGFAAQAVALYYQLQQVNSQTQAQGLDIKAIGFKVDSMIDRRNEDAIANMKRDLNIQSQREKIEVLEKAITAQTLKGNGK